jgi:kynurenine formamidase
VRFGVLRRRQSGRSRASRRVSRARRRDDPAAAHAWRAARRGRWKGVSALPPNSSIGADDLDACARAHGVEVRAGDVLLVRTGYAVYWKDEATYLTATGVAKSGSIWAADKRVVAVGADNMAWDAMHERDPDTKMTLFGHAHLLVRHGIHIIENLNLEELAAAGDHEFCFVGVPLKFTGATGSPIRPLALV